MANDNLYLDIHVIQTLPPSCVNRDDTGSPKTAFYGGVNRARVSSQSWKKGVRDMFKDLISDKDKVGVRTLRVVDMVAKEIAELGGEKPEKMARDIVEKAKISLKEEKKKDSEVVNILTKALFFLSPAQAKNLALLAVEDPKCKTADAQRALNEEPGIDVALFGRMVADDPALNTDASAQVAHAISTHAVTNEYDFYTALDELSVENHAGAGMLGTIEYNSSTLYRYATVAVHALQTQLGEDTPDALRVFIDAFIRSMPTGKQNTFAHRTLPSAVLITLRRDQPINFVGAFEKPVAATDEGYVRASERALVKHAQNTYKTWLPEPELSIVVGEGLGSLASPTSLQDACDKVRSYVLENL